MTGGVLHLLNRDGRYFARLVVPKELRPYMDGKTELRTALGPDYRTGSEDAPVQHQIALGNICRAIRPLGSTSSIP